MSLLCYPLYPEYILILLHLKSTDMEAIIITDTLTKEIPITLPLFVPQSATVKQTRTQEI